ncbi:MAG: dihydroorotate dehydrogenase-like protein [Bacteroidota bacterium]|jgi:dihydroorotate dehydrogenase (fumarate)|nr:dihydroorotate dehydrogenase-like protein [Bacteroidota bacterium]
MDLTTTYMGLALKNPLVPSASPLSKDLGTIKRLEDAGASAIVMYSLFEEQIVHEQHELDHFLTQGTESFQEALSYFPDTAEYALGPDEYLEHIRAAKAATSIPVIGSLNGVSAGGWLEYARKIEEAGADALELNVYYIPTSANYKAEEIENIYVEDLRRVKDAIKIPVAMKLSPYFSAMANMAKKLDDAGADALVLFNRFYQPDFDLEQLEVVPQVNLSTSGEGRLPLRWIAILYGNIKASMAATTGVHTHLDALKMLMAGADVTMMCSALLHHGPQHLGTVLADLEHWMEEKEYSSIAQMKGSMSQRSVAEPAAFERANYMKALNSWKAIV